jgi:hypothetical protein
MSTGLDMKGGGWHELGRLVALCMTCLKVLLLTSLCVQVVPKVDLNIGVISAHPPSALFYQTPLSHHTNTNGSHIWHLCVCACVLRKSTSTNRKGKCALFEAGGGHELGRPVAVCTL